MIRLLNIELRKIMPYRVFWIMAILYLASVAFIFYGFPSLIDYFSMKSNAPEVKLLKNFIYNFPDIWQNLTWVISIRFFIKVFLGIIVIVLITNEYSYGTIRQNIMSGLSRTEFLLAKIYIILFIALIVTLFVMASGLILGLLFSSSTSFHAITGKIAFLGAYFLEITGYMIFAFMIGLLVKRTGIAISLLFVYPIIEIIIQQQLAEQYRPYLPLNALNHIIRTPNTSLIQYSSPDFNIDLQTHIAAGDVLVCLGYTLLFILVSYLVIRRKDL